MLVSQQFDSSAARPPLPPPSRPADPPPDPAVERLAAGLADTVNNALVGVIGSLELALSQAPPGSTVHEHIRDSLNCAWHAARTVRRVVAETRPPTRIKTARP